MRKRWLALLLAAVAVGLVPWTLWLTISLPARHVARHYDVAWVGFDVVLAVSFAVTALAFVRAPTWLAPAAAVTGTLLICDAWFDVVTSGPGWERAEAALLAGLAELPLAALCVWIVLGAERQVPVVAARRRRSRALPGGRLNDREATSDPPSQ